MLQYEQFLKNIGEKNYRIAQVHHAIFREFVSSWEEITTLPEKLRARMMEEIEFSPLKVLQNPTTNDGQTTKVLFETKDGSKIESVLMRHHKGGRTTVCVSSQVGCAMGCVFCATGDLGIQRNLTLEEIVHQVLYFCQLLKKNSEERHVTNIVFMGMGEPFMNYNTVMESIEYFHHPKILGLSARHITISTSGILAGITSFTQEKIAVNLALSLHAPTDELRSELMPVHRGYTVKKLFEVLDQYTNKTGKRVFYEYIMIQGKNDKKEHAKALGKLLEKRLAHVNLIPYNSVEKNPFQSSTKSSLFRFQDVLEEFGVPSTIRVSLGQEVDGACGQLAGQN